MFVQFTNKIINVMRLKFVSFCSQHAQVSHLFIMKLLVRPCILCNSLISNQYDWSINLNHMKTTEIKMSFMVMARAAIGEKQKKKWTIQQTHKPENFKCIFKLPHNEIAEIFYSYFHRSEFNSLPSKGAVVHLKSRFNPCNPVQIYKCTKSSSNSSPYAPL